jgi:hypothetical protein
MKNQNAQIINLFYNDIITTYYAADFRHSTSYGYNENRSIGDHMRANNICSAYFIILSKSQNETLKTLMVK